MVEFPVGQPREPPRRPEKQRYRLNVVGQAVQAIAEKRGPAIRRIRSLTCFEASTL